MSSWQLHIPKSDIINVSLLDQKKNKKKMRKWLNLPNLLTAL